MQHITGQQLEQQFHIDQDMLFAKSLIAWRDKRAQKYKRNIQQLADCV